ncbi:MAG: hypothetical protein WKG06_07260 [Segetibacter sp.]
MYVVITIFVQDTKNISHSICDMTLSNECKSETVKISNELLPLEPIQINCSKKDDVINKLKRIAFNSYSKEERCHFEWIWDGSKLWIVQKDSEITEPGTKPGSNWLYKDVEIDHSNFKILKIDKDCKESWSKINNIKTFRLCDLPSAVFFVLEDFSCKSKLLNDEPCDALDEDLKILCYYPIVIRTSFRKDDNGNQSLNLPRTNTVFDWKTAKKFIEETIKKWLQLKDCNYRSFLS